MIYEKQENLNSFTESYWIEKFSGRMVQIEEFEYLYGDHEWKNEFHPMGVRYRYQDDDTVDFMGVELFNMNYRFFKKELTRLDLVS